jgi:hypothetical protein
VDTVFKAGVILTLVNDIRHRPPPQKKHGALPPEKLPGGRSLRPQRKDIVTLLKFAPQYIYNGNAHIGRSTRGSFAGQLRGQCSFAGQLHGQFVIHAE